MDVGRLPVALLVLLTQLVAGCASRRPPLSLEVLGSSIQIHYRNSGGGANLADGPVIIPQADC